jgi:hypothetical protein
MPEPDRPIDELVGTVGRAIAWMQVSLDQQVTQRRATREFAAAELERMTRVLHLLEDLRAGADAGLERERKLHISIATRRRA